MNNQAKYFLIGFLSKVVYTILLLLLLRLLIQFLSLGQTFQILYYSIATLIAIAVSIVGLKFNLNYYTNVLSNCLIASMVVAFIEERLLGSIVLIISMPETASFQKHLVIGLVIGVVCMGVGYLLKLNRFKPKKLKGDEVE